MPALTYAAPPAIIIPASSRYSSAIGNDPIGSTVAQGEAVPFASAKQDDTREAAVITSLIALIAPDEGEEPITPHALDHAIRLIDPILTSIRSTRDVPRIVDDGEGGIRMTWHSNDRELRAIIPGSPSNEQLIYWETESEYGMDKSLTALSLSHYLGWIYGRHSR